jgi:hypothetical protein
MRKNIVFFISLFSGWCFLFPRPKSPQDFRSSSKIRHITPRVACTDQSQELKMDLACKKGNLNANLDKSVRGIHFFLRESSKEIRSPFLRKEEDNWKHSH